MKIFKNKLFIIMLLIVIILSSRTRRKEIYKKYISLTREKPEKCWLHKANNLEKLKKFINEYPGVEIDIHYNLEKNFYDVTHEVKDSKNLSLEEYFKILEKTKIMIWLDLKNLNHENLILSKNLLDELLRTYNINKSRIILESPEYELLKEYKNVFKKYYLVYYDDFFYKTDKLDKITQKEWQIWQENILKIAHSKDVNAISFPIEMYDYISQLNLKIDLLTWIPNKEWELLYKNKLTKKVLEDERIKIILVKDE